VVVVAVDAVVVVAVVAVESPAGLVVVGGALHLSCHESLVPLAFVVEPPPPPPPPPPPSPETSVL